MILAILYASHLLSVLLVWMPRCLITAQSHVLHTYISAHALSVLTTLHSTSQLAAHISHLTSHISHLIETLFFSSNNFSFEEPTSCRTPMAIAVSK